MEIELPDVKSFIEYYREHRENGVLAHDIVIGKDEIYYCSSQKEKELFEKIHLEGSIHKMVTQFMLAITEFPDDVFHIQVKSKVLFDATPYLLDDNRL